MDPEWNISFTNSKVTKYTYQIPCSAKNWRRKFLVNQQNITLAKKPWVNLEIKRSWLPDASPEAWHKTCELVWIVKDFSAGFLFHKSLSLHKILIWWSVSMWWFFCFSISQFDSFSWNTFGPSRSGRVWVVEHDPTSLNNTLECHRNLSPKGAYINSTV